MPDIPLNPITLRYIGPFDLDGLYAAFTDWAKNYGYFWHEKVYKHKSVGSAGEQEMMWEITKDVDGLVSHFILIEAHIWDMKQIKVEKKGKEVPLTQARLWVKISGKMTYDRQKIFKGGKFTQWLGKWYGKLLQKDLESRYYDTFYYRVWNLHALFKKYFDVQSKKYVYKGYLGEN